MTVYRPVGEQDGHRPGSFFERHRRIVTVVVGAVLTAGFVYFVVPRVVGLGPTLRRLRGGRIGWLALGIGLEAFSMFGDIVTFRGPFVARGTPIGWRRTADIRMAGAAATKLLAAAGSGGIALTVWTLRGWGLSPRKSSAGWPATCGSHTRSTCSPSRARDSDCGSGCSQVRRLSVSR